jgi:hypothetical protein
VGRNGRVPRASLPTGLYRRLTDEFAVRSRYVVGKGGSIAARTEGSRRWAM